MNSEICLSCEAVERYLGEEEERVHALRGISLDIEPGIIHAVVGSSGCGKRTLLYILGLLDPPDAGRISIESEPVSHLGDDELAYKRNKFIGFIFQFHFLMKDFSAQENVTIPMRRLGQLSDAKIVQQGGKALLLATHNPVIAQSCDWIHEMKDGRITASHPRGTRNSIF